MKLPRPNFNPAPFKIIEDAFLMRYRPYHYVSIIFLVQKQLLYFCMLRSKLEQMVVYV